MVDVRPPPPPFQTKYIKNEDLYFAMLLKMCFVNIYIQYIALQNTDFGVLQKSSKHFLISIFFLPAGEDTTSCLEQQ